MAVGAAAAEVVEEQEALAVKGVPVVKEVQVVKLELVVEQAPQEEHEE